MRVVHLGLPDPEPPDFSPELQEKARGPLEAERQPAGDPTQGRKWNFSFTPQQKKLYGIEQGIPPLILGAKAYTLRWLYMARLDRVLQLSDGARQCTFTVTEQDGHVQTYTFNDWIAPYLYDDANWNIGGHYTLFLLADTITDDTHWASYFGWHNKKPYLCSDGLISHFPLWSFWPSNKETSSIDNYLSDHPSRAVREQPFIRTTWRDPWPKELSKLLSDYIEYVAFWTISLAWELNEDPTEIRAAARNEARVIPQCCFRLARSVRKRVGLPYDMKD